MKLKDCGIETTLQLLQQASNLSQRQTLAARFTSITKNLQTLPC
jgi:hypothetical protein